MLSYKWSLTLGGFLSRWASTRCTLRTFSRWRQQLQSGQSDAQPASSVCHQL